MSPYLSTSADELGQAAAGLGTTSLSRMQTDEGVPDSGG